MHFDWILIHTLHFDWLKLLRDDSSFTVKRTTSRTVVGLMHSECIT